MNIKILKTFTILPIALLSICYGISCSNDQKKPASVDYLIDGSNWSGVEEGNFKPEDYKIDLKTNTITYHNGTKIYGKDIVIPDYVTYKNMSLKVLLGEGCFANNHFIDGTFTFNYHTTIIPKRCLFGCDGIKWIVFKNYITVFDDYCFCDCGLLKGFSSNPILLSKLKYIGDYALYYTLVRIDFPFGGELEKIGDYAFARSSALMSINFFNCDKLTEIGDYCFYECDSLFDVTFSNNIKKIGNYAFAGCGLLDIINLPYDNMSFEVGQGAFNNNSNFIGFSRKCQFTKLGMQTFNGCQKFKVTEYMLSNPSLHVIPDYAFGSCNNDEIIIPKNIKVLCQFAFTTNSGDQRPLSIVDFSAYDNWTTPIICGANVFDHCDQHGTIYIPIKSSYDQWRNLLEHCGFNFGGNNWVIKTH